MSCSEMGSWLQRERILQTGGEIITSKYYRYMVRVLILLGTATSVAFLLLAWTQTFDVQSLALHWDISHSMATYPSETMLRYCEIEKSSTGDVSRQRGVGLLHAWTDSELFSRVATNEKIRDWKTNSSSSRTPKIAFMFLILDELPFEPLWNRFFKGHEDFYNIYIHMWPLKLSAFRKSDEVFGGRLIPSEEGKKLTPGLIANARRLLANALLDDPSNEWFALISESCIPIRGFRHVYDTLASTNKSFLDADVGHWDMWNRYVARGDNAMQPEIEFGQFRVGSQFWVMRRRHAVMTVEDVKYWEKFNKPCVPEHQFCYPEEHYFPTLMAFLDPGGMHHSATVVDWSRVDHGHPTEWQATEISLDFIRGLQQRDGGDRMFARKFHRDCLQRLLDIDDSFWKD